MPEQPYLNREIDEKLSDIKELMLDVKVQTTKTNGRVTKLERWQHYVLGFCACVSILIISIAVPVLTAYISAGKL